MGGRAKEYRRLRNRLIRVTITRRRGALLTATAERQASELAAAIDPEHDVKAAFWLGMFHWMRYQSLPAGADQEDAAAAARFFAPVYRKDPQLIPAAMRRQLEQYQRWGQTPGAGPEEHRGRALALVAEHGHGGEPSLLSEAVALLRASVLAIPDRDPDRADFLSDLGVGLRLLSEATGGAGDLAEAISSQRAAIDVAASGSPSRVSYEYNLAVSLATSYERWGDSAALEEAITLMRGVVAAVPEGDPKRGTVLAGLASALRWRYDRWRRTGDLDEAARTHRAAIAATPAGDEALAGRWSNLGTALQAMFDDTDDVAKLNEAIRAHRAAVAASAAGHADRAGQLANLAAALTQLAEVTGEADPLEEAIRVSRGAVAAAPDPDPRRAEYLFNLGYALQLRGESAQAADSLAEAVAGLVEASENAGARAEVRIRAYQQLARLVGDRPGGADALAAMEAAVGLLPQIARGSLARRDREHQLGRLAGIAGDAAAAAISAGQPGHAAELLEQARGVLIADALRARSGYLTALAAAAPDLASADLASADLASAYPAAQSGLAAGIGPVVFVNTSPVRCDALIVTPGGAPVAEVVPLTGLTKEEAHQQASKFASAQMAAALTSTGEERDQAEAEMLEVLAWTWDTITEPVLGALGHITTPAKPADWPRIWWCPVGALAYLPLHAAGHHDDLTAGDPARAANPRTVLDRVISSYAITLRALAFASRQVPAMAASSALIVAVPYAPGAPLLPGAMAEAAEIAGLMTGARVVAGSDATHDKVLAALRLHAIAHFACHGYADMADPGTGMLVLPDHEEKPLTVSEIGALRLNGGLAYLSACQTSLAPPELTDEAVHITGAFHLAGYQHVIGTLWPVPDGPASELAVAFYRCLTGGGSSPDDLTVAAQCLHQAVRELRGRYPRSPTHWAAHTHTGP